MPEEDIAARESINKIWVTVSDGGHPVAGPNVTPPLNKTSFISAILQNSQTLQVLSLHHCKGLLYEDIITICNKCINLKV